MAHYKNIKYPSLMLLSLCMSFNAFGSSAVSSTLTCVEEVKRDDQYKTARIVSPSPSEPAIPTLAEIKEIVMRKVQVIKTEFPKAQSALNIIEQLLVAKAKGLQSTNFLRATELAGLVSGSKVLGSSLNNTVILVSRDDVDDNAWVNSAISVIGAGALKDQLIQFAGLLGSKDDTQDIDCRVLIDVGARINEITKDIETNFKSFQLSDS